MDTAIFSALIPAASATERDTIATTLARFGEGALQFAAAHGVQIRALDKRERYDEASPALKRLGVDVDAWPSPPAGLFVVEERIVYLRSRSAMTIAHEFGHALDLALGGNVYRSSTDPAIREAYRNATRFVTPYAATAIDEYFAECVRSWVGINDEASFWPTVSQARLRRCDPAMYSIVREIFASFERSG